MFQTPSYEGVPTILLVEDEEIVRDVITETLTQSGYDVVPVSNGYAALEALEDLPNIALLVTDVSMPGLSGAELAQRVKALRPASKALLISGYAMGNVPDRGDTPYLQKPFMPDELMAKIQEVLRD